MSNNFENIAVAVAGASDLIDVLFAYATSSSHQLAANLTAASALRSCDVPLRLAASSLSSSLPCFFRDKYAPKGNSRSGLIVRRPVRFARAFCGRAHPCRGRR